MEIENELKTVIADVTVGSMFGRFSKHFDVSRGVSSYVVYALIHFFFHIVLCGGGEVVGDGSWCGVVWCGVVVVWCGVVVGWWGGVACCGGEVVWCGLVCCGGVWFGVVWFGVVV